MSRPWVEEATTTKDIIADLIKPKTLNDVLREHELENAED
jgi:hypothetical protein